MRTAPRTALAMALGALALGSAGTTVTASAHGAGAGMRGGEVAYHGGVEGGRGAFATHSSAGRSSFRSYGSSFGGSAGDWGFAHRMGYGGHEEARGFERHPFHDRRGREWRGRGWRDRSFAGGGYGYGRSYPYAGYDDAEGPPQGYGYDGMQGFGPQTPYDGGLEGGSALEMDGYASALAPSAYGPGAKDGAYAYGYNGYAPTPSLAFGPDGYTPVYYPTTRSAEAYGTGPTPCGC